MCQEIIFCSSHPTQFMVRKVAVQHKNGLYAFDALEFILYLRNWNCINLMGPNWLLH